MNDQAPAADDRGPELIDYLRVLLRWKWLLIVGTVAVAAVTLAIGLTGPRTYEATVTLLVTESKIPRPEGTDALRAVPPETFEAIIRSQALALETIRQFGLDKAPLALTPARFRALHLAISTARGTGVITIRVVLPDPTLAADVANFVARRALELNARLNQSDTVSTKEYIQGQRDEARTTLQRQQAALVDFKRTANLESLRAQQRILLDAKRRLAELHADYTLNVRGLQVDVTELRRALAKQEPLLTVTKSIFEDPALLAAARERAAPDLKALASIQLRSQEVNSVYQELQTSVITKEVALSSLERQRQDVERKIADNDKSLAATERQIADSDARLEELTRNYTLTKNAYELFARRFDEASLSVASRITELKIVDPALVPQVPVARRVVQRAAIAAAVTLALLVALVFFLEYVKTARLRSLPAG